MIIFNGPTGNEIQNPTEQFIRNIIFEKDDEYWKTGSGDACIEVEECKERLIFFYESDYGFFIMRHPDYLVLCDDQNDIHTVVHDVGGEPMQVPSCSFVSREKALDILISFMRTGEILYNDMWIDMYDIDFEYDF